MRRRLPEDVNSRPTVPKKAGFAWFGVLKPVMPRLPTYEDHQRQHQLQQCGATEIAL
jgi:hypothetical protein